MASNELEARGESQASTGSGSTTAPGKRTLTGAIQRRATAARANDTATPVRESRDAAVGSDAPFALHMPVQRHGDGAPTSEAVHAAAERGTSGASATLPHLAAIQQSFGRHDVSGIGAHVDGAAAEGTRAMGAEAFATGTHVAFATGAPSLHIAAHEAAHVVQQRAGVHLAGGVGAVGDVYERHADEVADAVVAGRSSEALLDRHAGSGGGTSAVQCRKPGDAPPELEDQLESRLGVRDEKTQLPTEAQLVGDVDNALLQANAPPTPTTAAEIVEKGLSEYAFHNNYGTAQDLNTQAALVLGCVMQAWMTYDPGGLIPYATIAQALQARMQPHIRQAVAAWCNQHQHPVPSNAAIDVTFHYDVNGLGNGPGPNPEAKRFLADHPMTQGFTGTLQQNDKLALIDGLKRMPTVKRALGGMMDWHNQLSVQGKLRSQHDKPSAQWLDPKIEVDDGSARGLGDDEDDRLIPEKNVSSSCLKNIHEAMARICGLVEPGRLALAGQPVIFVHLAKDRTLLEKIQSGDFSQAKKMRAYSESYEKAIHIDNTDPIKTIVHEVGHQLENQLPTELWLDIHRMIRGRHQQSVNQDGKNELESIYPDHDNKEVRKEPRFRATMPATGGYSAKSYDGPGATEVLSMSMEYLSEPATAKKLIENDPLQAAIVLRGIALSEFTMFVPQNLLALLPS